MSFSIAKYKNTKIQKYKITHEVCTEKQFNPLDYNPSIPKNLITTTKLKPDVLLD
jgi:hypothetical protein